MVVGCLGIRWFIGVGRVNTSIELVMGATDSAGLHLGHCLAGYVQA